MRKLPFLRGLRPGLITVAFAMALAGLIGGWSLAHNLQVEKPLAGQLKALPGVRNYRITPAADGEQRLELSLERVPDLEQLMDRVAATIGKYQKAPIGEIVIHDARAGLEQVYYQLRFSLEEAMATGRYTRLRSDLGDLSRRFGLHRAQVYLGQRFVYVQLEKGPKYLYEVLPRAAWGQIPESSRQGGDV